LEKKCYIALDFVTTEEAIDFLDLFHDDLPPVKIGMSLFYRGGLGFVEELCQKGYDIFLDLKSHDIPNTVYLGVSQLSQFPIDLLTVHALGGSDMIKAAVSGSKEAPYHPKILAITQLTSTTQEQLTNEQGINESLNDSVSRLAKLAYSAGADGTVSAVDEVPRIKAVTEKNFLCVTPGIRFEGGANQDQKRVATPAQAFKNGADHLVVGRPIIHSEDPVSSYHQVIKCLEGVDYK